MFLCHHRGWKLEYWKERPFLRCTRIIKLNLLWIYNDITVQTKTLPRINLSVVKLLKRRALKVGSLCLSLVIDFPSAISLSIPRPLCFSLLFPPSLSTYPPSAHAHHLTHPSSRPVLINQTCGQHEEQGYVNGLCQEPATLRCLLACLLAFLPATLPCVVVCLSSRLLVCP